MQVVVLFRHGARAPSEGALEAYQETEIAKKWSSEELGKLTKTGVQQCKALGKHLAKYLQELVDKGEIKSFDRAKWFSSSSDRVLQSGMHFIEGFLQGLDENSENTFDKESLRKPEKLDNPDKLFRPWCCNKDYEQAKARLLKGEDTTFIEKARSEEEFLRKMQVHMSGQYRNGPLHDTLYRMTYATEVIECERNSAQMKLSSMVSEDEARKIFELGLYAWNYRFFDMPHSRVLGIPMLDHILNSNETETLRIYSSHDYTILSLLSALGVTRYPEPVLGFCAHLVLYLEDSIIVKAEILQNPFSEEEILTVKSHPTSIQLPKS